MKVETLTDTYELIAVTQYGLYLHNITKESNGFLFTKDGWYTCLTNGNSQLYSTNYVMYEGETREEYDAETEIESWWSELSSTISSW